MRTKIFTLFVMLVFACSTYAQNAVGNQVYSDANNNGLFDSGEGVSGVLMELLIEDPNNNGAFNPHVTTTTDANGIYYFDNLADGAYKVRVAASNFSGAGALATERNIGGWDVAGFPFYNVDHNDNGTDGAHDMGIISQEFSLVEGSSPTGEDQTGYTGSLPDANVNATLDFGFNDYRTFSPGCTGGATEQELDWNQFAYSTSTNTTTIGDTEISIAQVSEHNASSGSSKFFGDKDQGYGFESIKTLEIFDFAGSNGEGSMTFTFSPAVENVSFSVYGISKSDVVSLSGTPTLSTLGHDPSYAISGSTATADGSPETAVNSTMDVLYEGSVSSITITYNMPGGFKPEFIGISNIKFCQPVALPVEFTSIQATAKSKSVNVTWETASEINNEMFVIERASDARNFEAIGKVAGVGNSTTTQSYSFEDLAPVAGTNYYRIKQVDFDGAFEYSEVVAVEMDKVSNIRVVPTATYNWADIYAAGSKSVAVYSMSGELMTSITSEEGAYQIDLNDWAQGVYLVQINYGSYTETAKLIRL